LDRHAFSIQAAQLTRPRNYADERFSITSRHPRSAPEWTYVNQAAFDTDISESNTPANIESDEETVEDEREGSATQREK
jgi:hypothetical protein